MPIDFQLENKNKPKLEAKNNKNSSELQEKIEQIKKMCGKAWSNPYVKASTVAVGTLAIIISSKLIYDAIKNNKNINGVNLTPEDVSYINNNYILFAQETPYCWNNVFWQLFASPDNLSFMNDNYLIHDSEKMLSAFNFIKKEFSKPITGNRLCRRVAIDAKTREKLMPDDVGRTEQYWPRPSWIKDRQFHATMLDPFYIRDEDYVWDNIKFQYFGIVESLIEKKIKNNRIRKDLMDCLHKERMEKTNNFLKSVNPKPRSFMVEHRPDEVPLDCCRESNYFPTFFLIAGTHFVSSNIVYDKNKNIKYFLWFDGFNDDVEVLSKDKGLARLIDRSKISREVYVKYSRDDIAEKFYTV